MYNAWERREKCRRFWWESPKERDHSDSDAYDYDDDCPRDVVSCSLVEIYRRFRGAYSIIRRIYPDDGGSKHL
jgi:hypothetical protein